MKHIFYVLLLIMLFVSCNDQTCDIGNKYAKKYAQGLAGRWQCKYELIYADMVKILNGTVCKNDQLVKGLTIGGDIASLACNAVVAGISKLGSMYLNTKWGCNADLVSADISKLGSACSLIGLL